MVSRVKWCKNSILLKWMETISNTKNDKGITLNETGANSLLKDINEIWDLLDDVQSMLSEEVIE